MTTPHGGTDRAQVVAVGFVPAAPLLVPSVAGGSAATDEPLRSACREVVDRLGRRLGDGGTIVVAAAAPTVEGEGATWDFFGFGLPRRDRAGAAVLPWPLGIGGWLLDERGWAGPRRYVGIEAGSGAPGPELEVDGPVAILAVGDGSARHSERAPGHLDVRAEGFDTAVAGCLAAGDVAGLAGLDAGLGAELMCAGAPVWRWLATALDGAPVSHAEMLADTAPYGVRYFAAYWSVGEEPA